MEENIRLGDASTALLPLDSVQQSRIDRAAELGGAAEFIAKLPKGMKTDFREHAEMPSVTQGADGRDILFAVMEADKQARKNQATSLSGGQAQRLALLVSVWFESRSASYELTRNSSWRTLGHGHS